MRNVAKINLELSHCTECPFCAKPEGYVGLYCQHDLKSPGLEVGDGDVIPDFCPFVIQRLEIVYKTICEGTNSSIPKKFLTQIEKKHRDDPNPKFFMDHSWDHIRRITAIGERFLGNCVEYGFSSPDTVQKEILLFKIAAYMHDIGLAETFRNHEIHSAELTKKYLSSPKIDIDLEDAYTIVHAISNHSKGEDTRTIIDAALILADKLDITCKRIVRPNDDVTKELLKIQEATFDIYGKNGLPRGAELKYVTDENFDVLKLQAWPKAISVPYRVTTEFLKLPEFIFTVNGEQIDIKEIIS